MRESSWFTFVRVAHNNRVVYYRLTQLLIIVCYIMI